MPSKEYICFFYTLKYKKAILKSNSTSQYNFFTKKNLTDPRLVNGRVNSYLGKIEVLHKLLRWKSFIMWDFNARKRKLDSQVEWNAALVTCVHNVTEYHLHHVHHVHPDDSLALFPIRAKINTVHLIFHSINKTNQSSNLSCSSPLKLCDCRNRLVEFKLEPYKAYKTLTQKQTLGLKSSGYWCCSWLWLCTVSM